MTGLFNYAIINIVVLCHLFIQSRAIGSPLLQERRNPMICCINEVEIPALGKTVIVECLEDFPRWKKVRILVASGVESSFWCSVFDGVIKGLYPHNLFCDGPDPTVEEKFLLSEALAQLKEDGIFDENNKCRCPRACLRLY